MRRILRGIAVIGLGFSAAFAQETRFEISFAPAAHAGPITGRVFVALAKAESPEPIRQIGSWNGQTPFFAADVDQLAAGSAAVIDSHSQGFPAQSPAPTHGK